MSTGTDTDLNSNKYIQKDKQSEANHMIISNISIPSKINETTLSNINHSKNYFYQIPNEVDEIEEENKHDDYFDYDNYFLENEEYLQKKQAALFDTANYKPEKVFVDEIKLKVQHNNNPLLISTRERHAEKDTSYSLFDNHNLSKISLNETNTIQNQSNLSIDIQNKLLKQMQSIEENTKNDKRNKLNQILKSFNFESKEKQSEPKKEEKTLNLQLYKKTYCDEDNKTKHNTSNSIKINEKQITQEVKEINQYKNIFIEEEIDEPTNQPIERLINYNNFQDNSISLKTSNSFKNTQLSEIATNDKFSKEQLSTYNEILKNNILIKNSNNEWEKRLLIQDNKNLEKNLSEHFLIQIRNNVDMDKYQRKIKELELYEEKKRKEKLERKSKPKTASYLRNNSKPNIISNGKDRTPSVNKLIKTKQTNQTTTTSNITTSNAIENHKSNLTSLLNGS